MKCGKTVWHNVAERGHVEILGKLCDWARDLQIKPEELRNGLFLSYEMYGKTAWNIAAQSGHIEVIGQLWDWAKELEELRNGVFFNENYGKTVWHNAAECGHVEILGKLREWTKDLHLKPDEF
jgi:ankyrin repeat protein